MANYIVSYDLNGSMPTHRQMDEHLGQAGADRGRLLETVWYVKTSMSLTEIGAYIDRILSPNDRLIVIEATDAYARNLLIPNKDVGHYWQMP